MSKQITLAKAKLISIWVCRVTCFFVKSCMKKPEWRCVRLKCAAFLLSAGNHILALKCANELRLTSEQVYCVHLYIFSPPPVCWALSLLCCHGTLAPHLQSVFVFLLKTSSPEPKAEPAETAAEPETQDEVFGKPWKKCLEFELSAYSTQHLHISSLLAKSYI